MKAKIVLVRPVYEENIGLVARAMANFGFKEISLVKPECDFRGGKAKSRAMHGKDVLLKANVFDSLEEALKGSSYAIATSAKERRNRPFLKLPSFVERFSGSRGKVALVFGPEPSGLSADEIDACDFVVSIPASKKYSTLNLSHAVCVMLYSLSVAKGKKTNFAEARPASKKKLLELFEADLKAVKGINDKAMVRASFKALLARSLLSEKEAKALTAFFGKKRKEK